MIFSEENPKIILHGLNAVYLKDLDKWIRLDARGNKENVTAQFSVEQEKLAFPIRNELGETDDGIIYAVPNANVVLALEKSTSIEELENNLPTEIY